MTITMSRLLEADIRQVLLIHEHVSRSTRPSTRQRTNIFRFPRCTILPWALLLVLTRALLGLSLLLLFDFRQLLQFDVLYCIYQLVGIHWEFNQIVDTYGTSNATNVAWMQAIMRIIPIVIWLTYSLISSSRITGVNAAPLCSHKKCCLLLDTVQAQCTVFPLVLGHSTETEDLGLAVGSSRKETSTLVGPAIAATSVSTRFATAWKIVGATTTCLRYSQLLCALCMIFVHLSHHLLGAILDYMIERYEFAHSVACTETLEMCTPTISVPGSPEGRVIPVHNWNRNNKHPYTNENQQSEVIVVVQVSEEPQVDMSIASELVNDTDETALTHVTCE